MFRSAAGQSFVQRLQDLEHDPAHPTRKDKEQRFAEIMSGQKGGSRANYHLILKRLRKEGRLEAETFETVQVRGKRPPDIGRKEEVAEPPADLPQRDAFIRPVTGGPGPVPGPARTPLVGADDTVGWERPPTDDEDE
jgi:hypothetical protein